MNGVFFGDFLVHLPLHHPIQYVYDYYAKYPALAFPHWPPPLSLYRRTFLSLFFGPFFCRSLVG